MTRSAQIIAFPAAKTPAASASAVQCPERSTREPFREWLDPASLRAVADDRPDMGEWLRARAVPEPSLGGKLGIAIMLLVAAALGAMLAGAVL